MVSVTCRKFLLTIPAGALGTSDGVQVLVWDWEGHPVEADVRTPADPSVTWTPVSLVGGNVERVA